MNKNQNNTNNNQTNAKVQNPQEVTNNILNNMEAQAPQVTPNNTIVETPVLENQVQAENVKESEVVDMDTSDEEAPKNDASDITFDYNEIYGPTETKTDNENEEDNNLPVFDEKEIVIDENKLKKDTNDIVPEFKINELDGSSAETEVNKSLDEIMDDKEADKADTRRKIVYILAIALILIIFVWFIFPIMAGYNM